MRIPVILLFVLAAALPQQTFTGVVELTDPIWEDTRHYDAFPIELAQHQHVAVHMTSEEFDTYLMLRAPSGLVMSNDDFEGVGSRLDFIAPEAGEWTIMASAYATEAVGAYTVDVELGGIGEVETIAGRLDPSDAEAIKGEYYDTHLIQIDGDGPFTIELTAYGFDSFLVVRSPAGQTWRNDDADDISRSVVGPLSGAGEWTVHVTTAGPGGVGAYDLNVIRFP
jgi:hypothetical protein